MQEITHLLQAVEHLKRVFPELPVPEGLGVQSGTSFERQAQLATSAAELVEAVVMETVQSGLTKKLAAAGFQTLDDVAKALDRELTAIDGVGKQTVKTLRTALGVLVDQEVPDEEVTES